MRPVEDRLSAEDRASLRRGGIFLAGFCWGVAFAVIMMMVVSILSGCAAPKQDGPKFSHEAKSDFIAVRSAREADVYCTADSDCDDGLPQTEDLCLISGECIHDPGCLHPNACIGGNPNADVGCLNGVCCWYLDYLQDCDYDSNLAVDASDLAHLLMGWGPITHLCDARDWDGDGLVNATDLSELLFEWGPRFN